MSKVSAFSTRARSRGDLDAALLSYIRRMDAPGGTTVGQEHRISHKKDQIGTTKTMSNYTQETLPTQFVEADGIRYAYRRFGKAGTIPLLFLGGTSTPTWTVGTRR